MCKHHYAQYEGKRYSSTPHIYGKFDFSFNYIFCLTVLNRSKKIPSNDPYQFEEFCYHRPSWNRKQNLYLNLHQMKLYIEYHITKPPLSWLGAPHILEVWLADNRQGQFKSPSVDRCICIVKIVNSVRQVPAAGDDSASLVN